MVEGKGRLVIGGWWKGNRRVKTCTCNTIRGIVKRTKIKIRKVRKIRK